MPNPNIQERVLSRWNLVWLAVALFIILPACSTPATPASEPTATPPVLASPTAPEVTADFVRGKSSRESYGVLVRQVFSDVADLTRILSDVSIQLGSVPESALKRRK